MKSAKTNRFLAILVYVILMGGCGKHNDNEKSIADRQLDKLSGSWKTSGVTLDGVAKDTYPDFKLTFSIVQGAKIFHYTTAGRPDLSPWPALGTFTFNDANPATQLLRDDNIPFKYNVTETKLTLQFNYAVAGFTNREGSVKGAWQFDFDKE